MSLPRTVEVNILGRKFNIKTDKEGDYVKDLANKLGAMIDKVKSGNSRVTLEKALVVSSFYLIDENERLKKQIQDLGQEIKRLEQGANILIKPKR